MRIAQVSTLSTPVRKTDSDSIESLVYFLSRELARQGHDVTVFAAAGSEVECKLVASLPGSYDENGAPADWHICEWMNLCRAVEQSGDFDILHSHAYLWGLPIQALSRAPMLHTLHVTPYDDQARLWRLTPGARVSAISNYQWSAFPELRPIATVYHGIDVAEFQLQAKPADYLCFIGRFIPQKGVLEAIEIARALNIRLLLAGPRNDYFQQEIEPHIDGKLVQYAGYVSGEAKQRLLGGARAVLYPVRAPEPFGLVLIEAMMCGTPVAATNLGAVSEVIDYGKTGYYANSAHELLPLMDEVMALDRAAVRQIAEQRFSSTRMAAEYLSVYQRLRKW